MARRTIDYRQLSERAGKLAAGFSTGQKAVTVVALLALVIGGAAFMNWASKPSYQPLFSNLDPTDAAAITEKLTSSKVPYQLADGGHTILVPAGAVYQQRLNMSAQGLPQSDAGGYALLDKEGVTTSEFRQRIDYQRALEGELTRTIQALDGVQAASVHLVIPPDDLFSDSSHNPSASVLIKTQLGQTLPADQVQAVVHLVSSSVEGLDPGQVTVADAAGHVLAAPGQDGFGATVGDTQDRKTQEFDRSLGGKLQDMLGQVLGPGHAVVQVNAQLDFDQRDTTSESYVTGQKVPVLSETTAKEAFKGSATPAAGILGPNGGALTSTSGQGSSYDKQSATRDFGVGKVTEQVKAAPGQVRRLSVAVLLDAAAKGADPAAIQQAVAAAAGIDPKRGDTLQVSRMAFDTTAATQAAKDLARQQAQRTRSQLVNDAETGAVVLLAVVVLLLAVRSLRKAAPRREAIEVSLERADPAAAELEADATPEAALEAAAAARALAPPAMSEQRARVQDEVGGLIERQPDEVAQLLRSWLADRRAG
jgi:flagellar M-ring protein FliF